MATAKKPANTPAARRAAATVRRAASKSAAVGSEIHPIQDSFTRATLATHAAEQAGVERRVAKAVLAALEQTVRGALHKQGLQSLSRKKLRFRMPFASITYVDLWALRPGFPRHSSFPV